jgi:D-alanyl-D-alanine carboxypeptidase/D-alanyl-D-alanine-endopeptidase (penicillin-binding protein 4)
MTRTPLSRRTVLAGLVTILPLPSLASPMLNSLRPRPRGQADVQSAVPSPGRTAVTTSVATTPQKLVEAARLGGSSGFAVIDWDSGRLLESFNAEAAMPPASVAKTITSLYALERLGASHRFVTRVLAVGPVTQGILQGDLILLGGGDPTLSSDDLGDLLARLAASGLRGVNGRFLVHADALPQIDSLDEEQPVYAGYNPGLCGLNLNFNRVHFEWKRANAGWQLAMDARADRFAPAVSMARMQVVTRDAPLFTYKSGQGTDEWTVASAALGNSGARWLPVRHPALYAAEVFRALAAAQGISGLPVAELVQGPPPAGARELGQHASWPLDGILRDMLRHSTNLTAECVGLSASGARGLQPSGRMMSDWAASRYGMKSDFHDHSGLGAASRTSPLEMAMTLRAADRAGAGLRGLLREVGMRDAQGKAIANHPVQVLAKTGTLNFCSGLAGFIAPPRGNTLVFAIFSADVARRAALPPAAREKPQGLAPWLARARKLQGQLIARWAEAYTA